MAQFDPGNMASPLPGASFIDEKFEPWVEAVKSNHSGASRPSYVVAQMDWIDTSTTPWTWKVFDGTDDIIIGTINATTNAFVPSGVPTQWAGTSGGSSTAYTLTPSPALTAYAAGVVYECLIATTNTAAGPTVNISGLGAKTAKCSIGVGKVNVPIGGLQAGMIARFVYDGTDLLLLNIRAYNPGTAIASASTTNLDVATGDFVHITGTNTINQFTLAQGQERTIIADGAFTLTNSANIIIPGGANIVAVVGDSFVIRGEGGTVCRIIAGSGISATKAQGGKADTALQPADRPYSDWADVVIPVANVGTLVTQAWKMMRTGNTARIRGCFVFAAVPASPIQIGMPTGLDIDHSKIPYVGSVKTVVGYGGWQGNNQGSVTVTADGTNDYLQIGLQNVAFGINVATLASAFTIGSAIFVDFEVPLTGW